MADFLWDQFRKPSTCTFLWGKTCFSKLCPQKKCTPVTSLNILMLQKYGINSPVEVGSWNPIIYKVFIPIPGGCLGFLNHQQFDSSQLQNVFPKNTPMEGCRWRFFREKWWCFCQPLRWMIISVNYNMSINFLNMSWWWLEMEHSNS